MGIGAGFSLSLLMVHFSVHSVVKECLMVHTLFGIYGVMFDGLCRDRRVLRSRPTALVSSATRSFGDASTSTMMLLLTSCSLHLVRDGVSLEIRAAHKSVSFVLVFLYAPPLVLHEWRAEAS